MAAFAVTNNAARNFGGTTLHRLFRSKINWEWSADGLWSSLQSRTSFQHSLLDIHTLIIDEISTVKGSILDAIDAVLRRLPRTPAQRDEPFGGRQIVVSGDPFQLQLFFDVAKTNTASAFLSRSWEQCFGSAASGRIVILSANHRQASDDCFYSMLSRLRKGRQTDKDLQTLNESCSASTGSVPPSHTRLVLTNEEAADINLKVLRKLEGSVIKMHACDTIFTKNPYLERQAHARLAHTAPKTIASKVGARVILTSKQACFYPGTELIILQMQPFVLRDGNNPRVSLICAPSERDGNAENIAPLLIEPLQIQIHDKSGLVIACREQLPVIPAYAINVHRSQALSFEKVAIDFTQSVVKRWAPEGLVYVALSRCKSFSCLWVRGLEHECTRTSDVAHGLMHEIPKIMQSDGSKVVTGPVVAMDLVVYLSLELSKKVRDMACTFSREKQRKRRRHR